MSNDVNSIQSHSQRCFCLPFFFLDCLVMLITSRMKQRIPANTFELVENQLALIDVIAKFHVRHAATLRWNSVSNHREHCSTCAVKEILSQRLFVFGWRKFQRFWTSRLPGKIGLYTDNRYQRWNDVTFQSKGFANEPSVTITKIYFNWYQRFVVCVVSVTLFYYAEFYVNFAEFHAALTLNSDSPVIDDGRTLISLLNYLFLLTSLVFILKINYF